MNKLIKDKASFSFIFKHRKIRVKTSFPNRNSKIVLWILNNYFNFSNIAIRLYIHTTGSYSIYTLVDVAPFVPQGYCSINFVRFFLLSIFSLCQLLQLVNQSDPHSHLTQLSTLLPCPNFSFYFIPIYTHLHFFLESSHANKWTSIFSQKNTCRSVHCSFLVLFFPSIIVVIIMITLWCYSSRSLPGFLR